MARLVQVDGLNQFVADLKAAGQKMPRELIRAGKGAAEVVVAQAKANASALGGVAAKAGPSVRASAGARFVALRAGGKAYPFFWGAEFGARRFRQFAPHTGNNFATVGYFVYPALRAKTPEVAERYAEALDEALKVAYPS